MYYNDIVIYRVSSEILGFKFTVPHICHIFSFAIEKVLYHYIMFSCFFFLFQANFATVLTHIFYLSSIRVEKYEQAAARVFL